MTDSESLLAKLKSMGVSIGANALPAQTPRRTGLDIETVLTGRDVSTRFGPAFITQEVFPLDHQHGNLALCEEHEMHMLAGYSGLSRILQPGGQNVVFLDTETSGLAGGTGTYAFLVGIGYRTPQGFEVVQFFMRDPGQEAALLAALEEWLARFDVIVTFNGKTFDLPLLQTRYILNGFTAPFARYEHLDVLQVARKLWRDRLPSRALGALEHDIIQFRRTGEEVPGWMIPSLYFDYLRSADARPLAGVFYHNVRDILSLAALYGYIADLLKDPVGAISGAYALDVAAIARIYEEMGLLEQAAQYYERSLEMGDFPEAYFFKTMQRFATLRRRQGDWHKAADLWRRAAERGQLFACVELAKFYEHHERNTAEALDWAMKARECLAVDRYFLGSNRALAQEVEKRIARLSQRAPHKRDPDSSS